MTTHPHDVPIFHDKSKFDVGRLRRVTRRVCTSKFIQLTFVDYTFVFFFASPFPLSLNALFEWQNQTTNRTHHGNCIVKASTWMTPNVSWPKKDKQKLAILKKLGPTCIRYTRHALVRTFCIRTTNTFGNRRHLKKEIELPFYKHTHSLTHSQIVEGQFVDDLV